jgi:hypothetical protein
MKLTFEKPKLRFSRFWLYLGLFVVLVAAYPAWQLLPRLIFDPRMPGSLMYTVQEHRNRTNFNSEIWKAFPRSTNEWPHTRLLPIRIRMIDDLLKRHDFRSQTDEAVEELLGPRTKTKYFSDWDLVYYLGPGRYGNAIGDSEWLVFKFNASNRVLEYKVVHD